MTLSKHGGHSLIKINGMGLREISYENDDNIQSMQLSE